MYSWSFIYAGGTISRFLPKLRHENIPRKINRVKKVRVNEGPTFLGHDLNEECYPYEAKDLKCRYEKSCEYTKGVVTDQVYSYGTNEEELKTMVVEYGPVVTGLDATALQFYDSGILDDFMCCDAADDFECVYVFCRIF